MGFVLVLLSTLLQVVASQLINKCTYSQPPPEPIPPQCQSVEINVDVTVTGLIGDVFDDVTELVEFTLTDTGMEEIPDLRPVGGTLLTLLLQRHPYLTSLPGYILTELVVLVTLVLTDCPLLVSIPDVPGIKPVNLDLSRSGFQYVPDLPMVGEHLQALSLFGPHPQLCDAQGEVSDPDRRTLQSMPNLAHLYLGGQHTPCDISFLGNKLLSLYFYLGGFTTIPTSILVPLPDLQTLGVPGNALTTLDNPCLDDLALLRLDSQGLVCDCRLRYLLHVPGQVAWDAGAKPCAAPGRMVGVRWGDMRPENFTCNTEKLSSEFSVTSTTLLPHRHGYCAWPHAVAARQVSSLLECATWCVHTEACQYFNVRPEGGGVWACHVTSYVGKAGKALDIGDVWAWESYLID